MGGLSCDGGFRYKAVFYAFMRIPGYISRRTAISGCGIALPYRLRRRSVRPVNTHKNRYLGRLGLSPPFYVYGIPMTNGLKPACPRINPFACRPWCAKAAGAAALLFHPPYFNYGRAMPRAT